MIFEETGIKSYGFTPIHINTIVSKLPSLLLADLIRNLAPKLKFFSKNGTSSFALVQIVTTDPFVLRQRLEKQINPCIAFHINVLESEKREIVDVNKWGKRLSRKGRTMGLLIAFGGDQKTATTAKAATKLNVSRLGFGCAGLFGVYDNPISEDLALSIIKHAFCRGITFFDTSDFYGSSAEVLIGKALKELPREKIQLATKFGLVRAEATHMVVNGTPEYVRSSCEATLKRLDVGFIDLYYQHRVDTSVPIEETMGELKKLVEEEKIKYIGLCEASSDTIRRAHAVHPITAIQMEWSLWTREIEEEILPLCRELGIGVVAYSPLGRGFFGGKAARGNLPANSFLRSNPRFQGENFNKNKIIYAKIEKLAEEKHRCSPAHLALAWIFHQGEDVVPIPGTTKTKNIDNNIGSLIMKFTEEELEEISAAAPPGEVAGARVADKLIRCSWRFANTPHKRQ